LFKVALQNGIIPAQNKPIFIPFPIID